MARAGHRDRGGRVGDGPPQLPGLVPGLLGAAIGFMSILLIVRALRGGALAQAHLPKFDITEHWRLAVIVVLGLFYALVLVGHGLPFWLASAIFITVFVVLFQFPERRANGTLAHGAAFAVVFALAAGLIIHYGFQDIFLVRVP
jgi:hypothetical protein